MKKLSDQIKEEIIQIYRQSDLTSSMLAERFDVSTSTITRILKANLSATEYDQLILNKKRAGKTSKIEQQEEEETILELPSVDELEDFDTEEDQDDQDEDENEDQNDDQEDDNFFSSALGDKINLQVLPIAVASFPQTCYLVIDRSAELITRPLREFAQLGKISSQEFQQKTLPIFDNHKVAKRFSNRSQRVIKVPDGSIFHKTSGHLKAKGITRLLIDGQIYSLT
jgi:transposase-like protein